MSYLIAGVLLLGFTLFLLCKRISQPAASERRPWPIVAASHDGRRSEAMHSGVAIPATKEMLTEEESAIQDTFSLLESRMLASRVFVPDRIPALLALLRAVAQPFSRVNTAVGFQGDTVLTVAEKSINMR